MEDVAGHVSRQMKKRYSHIRIETKRAALAQLAPAALPQTGKHRGGKVLTNESVLDLVAAGIPAKIVAAKVEHSPGNYDTSLEAIKALKAAGVHDSIILAMVEA